MPLQIVRRDITKMRVDAIVNTTNEEMVGYSGVDLAVHTAAGPELDKECERIAPLGLECRVMVTFRRGRKVILFKSENFRQRRKFTFN